MVTDNMKLESRLCTAGRQQEGVCAAEERKKLHKWSLAYVLLKNSDLENLEI